MTEFTGRPDSPDRRPLKIQIQIDGRAYEVEIEGEHDQAPETAPAFRAQLGKIQSIVLPTAGGPGVPVSAEVDESLVCRSPVAGIVVRVYAQAGAQLHIDEPMIVLESMKMETTVAAATAGKVKSVNVVPGQAVKVNQILVEFE